MSRTTLSTRPSHSRLLLVGALSALALGGLTAGAALAAGGGSGSSPSTTVFDLGRAGGPDVYEPLPCGEHMTRDRVWDDGQRGGPDVYEPSSCSPYLLPGRMTHHDVGSRPGWRKP